MTLGLLVASENVDRHTDIQDSCFISIDLSLPQNAYVSVFPPAPGVRHLSVHLHHSRHQSRQVCRHLGPNEAERLNTEGQDHDIFCLDTQCLV